MNSTFSSWGLPGWFNRAFQLLVCGVLFLIALGGSVRIMKAGLACPDWPLCFGDVIPDYHPQVYFEFMHRVVAGLISIVAVSLQVFLFRSRAPRALKMLGAFALVLLLTQVVFGGLTVLLLLKSYVVLTHLMLGTGFFLTLLWMFLSLRAQERSVIERVGPRWLLPFCIFVALAVYGQIFLGGMVASHFASLVCTDFPTCHGQWIPTLKGIIGLHVIHRLGAYTLFLILFTNWLVIRRFSPSPTLQRRSRMLFFGVCGQVCLGIANVLFYTPPLIAVAHLALGVSLLALAIMQVHWVRLCLKQRPVDSPQPGARDPQFKEILGYT
jgi:cytochrome c oxidase assembly protein subunit 15